MRHNWIIECSDDDSLQSHLPKMLVVHRILYERIQLFRQRPDKQWSLTDCISFVVMRRESITEALTGDHHFEQAGFVVLFK